jgi:hypothetical protein
MTHVSSFGPQLDPSLGTSASMPWQSTSALASQLVSVPSSNNAMAFGPPSSFGQIPLTPALASILQGRAASSNDAYNQQSAGNINRALAPRVPTTGFRANNRLDHIPNFRAGNLRRVAFLDDMVFGLEHFLKTNPVGKALNPIIWGIIGLYIAADSATMAAKASVQKYDEMTADGHKPATRAQKMLVGFQAFKAGFKAGLESLGFHGLASLVFPWLTVKAVEATTEKLADEVLHLKIHVPTEKIGEKAYLNPKFKMLQGLLGIAAVLALSGPIDKFTENIIHNPTC